LNVVLAVQMLWYWNAAKPLGSGDKKGKKRYVAGGKSPQPRAGGSKKA
jgi:hypothetical protein